MTGKLTEEEIGFIARPLVFVDFWTLMFSCKWVWEFEVVSNVICMLLFLFSNGGCPVAPPNQKLFFSCASLGVLGGLYSQKGGFLSGLTGWERWTDSAAGFQSCLKVLFLMHLKSGGFLGWALETYIWRFVVTWIGIIQFDIIIPNGFFLFFVDNVKDNLFNCLCLKIWHHASKNVCFARLMNWNVLVSNKSSDKMKKNIWTWFSTMSKIVLLGFV